MYPVLFKIGPWAVRSYGVFVALAFFTAFSLLLGEARRKKFYPDKILDMEFYMLVFGLLGARALHVVANIDFYAVNPTEVFAIWRGGLAFQGGLIAGLAACGIYIAVKKLPLWETADFIIPYIALGQSIGRIGCFFNGCCFGRPGAFPPQLAASFALLMIFIILRLFREKPHFSGLIFSLYLFLYGVQRFFIDFSRQDLPLYGFNLTLSQYISLGIVIFSFCVFIYNGKNKIHS